MEKLLLVVGDVVVSVLISLGSVTGTNSVMTTQMRENHLEMVATCSQIRAVQAIRE